MHKNNILLLEDDTNLSETVCEFLESKNYHVTQAYDGEEAEIAIYERQFDVLLLDVNVPNLNGFELLKKILEYDTCYLFNFAQCFRGFGTWL